MLDHELEQKSLKHKENFKDDHHEGHEDHDSDHPHEFVHANEDRSPTEELRSILLVSHDRGGSMAF